jgi:cytochrome c551
MLLHSKIRNATVRLSILSLLTIAFCCTSTTSDVKKPKDTSAKFMQYYNRGEELYERNCSNCHQKSGTGLGRLFPPLNKSDYLDNNLDNVLCLMRHGKSGELIVNGKSFNKEMKGIATLSDLEIAEIATYIYNTWENQRGIIDVSYVSNALQTCETAH